MDWESFFTDYGIDYVTRGPNVKRGNVNIACPYCGNDPSHHMGVSLDGHGFGCWRSADHAGKKPHNLVKAILGCSFNQAKIITQQYSHADPENLDEALASLEQTEAVVKAGESKRDLFYPREFRVITPKGVTRRFFNYLKGRGFTSRQVKEVCELYDLRCALTGRWKDRIIIPIHVDGELVSWTSRIIGKTTNAPRYLALGEDDETTPGKVNVFHSLWNWDELQEGGDVLFVVEGPFDAIKLDYFLVKANSMATCTFGTSMSEEQSYMIASVASKFKRTVLLYDPDAYEAIFRAQSLLAHVDITVDNVPEGVEDPGAMTEKQVLELASRYI